MRRLKLDVQDDGMATATLEGLAHVAVGLATSSKVVVGLGAGCSTSVGIPDFRSFGTVPGPASPTSSPLGPASRPLSVQATKKRFSYASLLQPESRADHLRFMTQLHRTIRRARSHPRVTSKKGKERAIDSPSAFHSLLAALNEGGHLERVYTQNIDGLERRAGLSVVNLAQLAADELAAESSGSEYDGTGSSNQVPAYKRGAARSGQKEGVVVPLHGGLDQVVCGACGWRERWRKKHTKAFEKGKTVDCKRCRDRVLSRPLRSRRSTSASPLAFLRPAILLYDDPHAASSSELAAITVLVDSDLQRGPDFLLIAGTSLRIPGFKQLVKRFASTVKRNGGLRVLVNRELVGKEWDSVFDYHVVGETDAFASHMADWLSCLANPPSAEQVRQECAIAAYAASTARAPSAIHPSHGMHSPAPSYSSTMTTMSIPTTPPPSSPFVLPAYRLDRQSPAAPQAAKSSAFDNVDETALPTPPPSSARLAPIALPPEEDGPDAPASEIGSVPDRHPQRHRPKKRHRYSTEPKGQAPPLQGMSAAGLLARAAVRVAREQVERRRAKRAKRDRRAARLERKKRATEEGSM